MNGGDGDLVERFATGEAARLRQLLLSEIDSVIGELQRMRKYVERADRASIGSGPIERLLYNAGRYDAWREASKLLSSSAASPPSEAP